MDAFDAGDVAGGGDDAAVAAAYYDGFIADIRVVAFFDAGVEGIAIHVGSGQIEEFGMRQQAGAVAFWATAGGFDFNQAITADSGHNGVISEVSPWGQGVKYLILFSLYKKK